MTAPGSESGNDTDTPNSWEELAEEEEKEILSPLGAVSEGKCVCFYKLF